MDPVPVTYYLLWGIIYDLFVISHHVSGHIWSPDK